MNWHPIADLSDEVDEILAFCPDNWGRYPNGRIWDDRICMVYRTDQGWRFDHYQGGYEVEPTLFCLLELPDGVPVDPPCS